MSVFILAIKKEDVLKVCYTQKPRFFADFYINISELLFYNKYMSRVCDRTAGIKIIAMGNNLENLIFPSANQAAEYFRNRGVKITPMQILRLVDNGKPMQHREPIYNANGDIVRTCISEYFFDELYEG